MKWLIALAVATMASSACADTYQLVFDQKTNAYKGQTLVAINSWSIPVGTYAEVKYEVLGYLHVWGERFEPCPWTGLCLEITDPGIDAFTIRGFILVDRTVPPQGQYTYINEYYQIIYEKQIWQSIQSSRPFTREAYLEIPQKPVPESKPLR